MRWTVWPRVFLVVVVWLSAACATDGEDPNIETGTPTVTADGGDSPPACTPPDTTGPSVDGGSTVPSTPESSMTGSSTSGATTSAPTTSGPDSTTTTTPRDPELAAAQTRLDGIGYWLGEVDGRPGPMTAHAVTAFQKAEGLPRTGLLDGVTLERLAVATRPEPRSGATALEVDLARQILLVASDGRVDWIFDIATGSAATPTPTGDYEIYNEIDGFRHAPLGTLYRPKYFNGGIALHGYTSVPSEPASHGCVRLTYAAMDFVWDAGLAPLSSAVSVY